ncbi:hypothetical protein PMAYCL1PPCAC_28477 [Pristionchus mayeri]|uniref:Tag-232 protein n=1 Tax=Pristionchus mayeri TaxID=1317129 RepID=A0AAN5D9Q6_9BILA|nr:hypothetical protein PMAYCL1PPCAC_28477 [Pristionchus mayeri]
MEDGRSFEVRMESHAQLHSAFLSHHRGIGPPVVPQKLFANWEMDRAHPSTVQRVFTLSISRLALFPCPSQMRSLVITAKLEGYKRSLRSNEIVLGDGGVSAIDLPLDISFTIQYPHFLKHKANVMQIHVQRKRKYKNRPIPGGFKSVAYGSIDLSAMLQSGQAAKSECALYAIPTSKQSSGKEQPPVTSIGRIVMQSCATLPLDAEGEQGGGAKMNKDKVVELSDDSEISEEEDSDLPNDGLQTGRNGRGQGVSQGAGSEHRLRDSQRRRKRAQHKKNMKQRLVNLLKKFRVPDEGGNEAAASSSGREPTAKELQALFDELDELSDSGNEGVAPDEISIVSNPRPALRPYFSSREQLPLPAIEDERASESEGEGEEWSSETEAAMAALQVPPTGPVSHLMTTRGAATAELPADPATAGVQQTPWPPSMSTSPWKGTGGGGGTREGEGGGATSTSSVMMTHSVTAGSIAVAREKDKVARNASLSDQLYAILSTSDGVGGTGGQSAGGGGTAVNGSVAAAAAASTAANECIWLCQFPDESMLDSLAAAHAAFAAASSSPRPTPPLHLIAATTARDVKAAIQQIVAKIQLFCNSNSVAPPITWIGVMGTDRLVSQVLRAYVDVLQHKSSSSWLQYLRFLLVVPPSSHMGRLVASHDSALEQLSRDIWERWAELTPAQHAAVAEKLCGWPTGRGGSPAPSVNFLIGEALVQLNTKDAKELAMDGNDRLFVPFLSEVRLCGEEEAPSTQVSPSGASYHPSSASNSPRGPPVQSDQPVSSIVTYPEMIETRFQQGQSSPPASPHTKGSSSSSSSDRGEVQVEYWVSHASREEREGAVLAPLMPGQLPPTPSGGKEKKEKEKENVKESMKSHFKTLLINRPSNSPLLKLQFVKEKKKDKMFQKLGMKNKSKNEVEASPSVIVNVSRLLCSAQGKHSLTVLVDGCAYGDVRFFSTSSQWQTHVKFFPVGLLTHHQV